MKKKLLHVIALVLVVCSLVTITVLASRMSQEYTKQLQEDGWTENDIAIFNEILDISKEQFPDKIREAFSRLKSWDEVKKEYGITEEKYVQWQFEKNLAEEILDIPQYIYDEMTERGYSTQEQRQFVFDVHSVQMDIEHVWAEIKNGKTLNQLFEERQQQEEEESEALTAFIIGDTDIETYNSKLESINSEAKISELLDYAVNLRKEVRERHIKSSGISEEEIELCREYGITNVMDMCQAKYISKGHNIDFQKVIEAKQDTDNWEAVISQVLDSSLVN